MDDVVRKIAELVKNRTPLMAIDVILESAPEDVKNAAKKLFENPDVVKSLDDHWRNVLLLIYFSHYAYLTENGQDKESISTFAVSSLNAAKLCRRLDLPDLEGIFLLKSGRVLTRMSMRKEAEKCYLEAEKIFKKLSEDGNEAYLKDLGDVLNDLAAFYIEDKRNDEAEKYVAWALEIRKKLAEINKKHLPTLAESLYNAGIHYSRTRRYELAEECYKEAVKILREASEEDPSHLPQLGVTLSNLANLYKKLARYDEAEKLYFEAKEIFEKLSKEDESYKVYLADSLGFIGSLYNDMMRFDEARKYYDKSKRLFAEITQKKLMQEGMLKESEQ
jgi:tetratricopeptide (TPR) repeat protein